MHESSINRMRWFIKNYLDKEKEYNVLDVGSYDVNGNYKNLFDEKQCTYTGLDMEQGPNVDIVPEHVYKWKEIKDDTYDVVISGQALEHIEFFWITVSEIVRVTKKDGIICLVAPNGFEEHRYPVDCWRFFTDGMVALARYYELQIIHAHTNCAPNLDSKGWYSEKNADSMLIAKKDYEGPTRTIKLENYKCEATSHKDLMGSMIPYEEANVKSRESIDNEEERGQEGESENKHQKEEWRPFLVLIKKIVKKTKAQVKKLVR